jgi:hypothetical protein
MNLEFLLLNSESKGINKEADNKTILAGKLIKSSLSMK